MDFTMAARLAAAWVDILCDGKARIVREATIAKPYGWIFFYDSNEPSVLLAGNAPILVDRNTSELRVTGTAKPLEHYVEAYEQTLPSAALQRKPQPAIW